MIDMISEVYIINKSHRNNENNKINEYDIM